MTAEIQGGDKFVQRLAAECAREPTSELTKESRDLRSLGLDRCFRLSHCESQALRVLAGIRRRAVALAPEPAC